MLSNMQEIEEKAFKLSSHERALLADHLIRSLKEEVPDAERLWIEEAERRYSEYKKGTIKARSADIVFKEAYLELE